MDQRFESRLSDMLAQAQVPPDLIDGLLSRLETFDLPFAASLCEPEHQRHTVEYLTGLLSKLEHKTSEGIASLPIKSDKASRSSSGRSRGRISPCSRRLRGGSAPTLNLSRPARCSLAFRPAHSPHRWTVRVSRRLRRLRCLHRRSDSFRLERSNLAGWDLHPLGICALSGALYIHNIITCVGCRASHSAIYRRT